MLSAKRESVFYHGRTVPFTQKYIQNYQQLWTKKQIPMQKQPIPNHDCYKYKTHQTTTINKLHNYWVKYP